MTPEQLMYKRLTEAARRACVARDRFEAMLEKAKSSTRWEAMCKQHGLAPEAEAGDWMC